MSAKRCEICGACGCGVPLSYVDTNNGKYLVCRSCVDRAIKGEPKAYPEENNNINATTNNSKGPSIFIKSIKWQ